MSKPSDITVIAGVSGVGKSYLIESLRNELEDVAHFSAGSLIKKGRKNTDRDQLRLLGERAVLLNQRILVGQFNKELRRCRSALVLFDAHMIIDIDTSTVEVPFEIFQEVGPSRIIHLRADPKTIRDRRISDKARSRPEIGVEKIAFQQTRSEHLARRHCQQLEIPFYSFDSDECLAFFNEMSSKSPE